MPAAGNTRRAFSRVALIFDFDDTLAEDTLDAMLRGLDQDPQRFRAEHVKPKVDDGWDPVPARFKALIDLSRRLNAPITEQSLRRVGEQCKVFPGVPEMFGRLRKAAREVVDDVEVEFHILSSGIAEIIRGAPIASEFNSIAAGEFSHDEQGRIDFVKRSISHVEKTRYCYAIARGDAAIEDVGSRPVDLHSPVPDDETHVPFTQLIYTGDGTSDVPVFSLMQDRGGTAIGVVKPDAKPEEWDTSEQIGPGSRVANVTPADYRDGGEMFQSLHHAVRSVCHRVALAKLSAGE